MKPSAKQRRPSTLERATDAARMAWESGAWRRPGELYDQWRHRHALGGMQRAFFQHRYAQAVLLARRLGVIESLAGGAASAGELAERCGLLEEAADTLLRILESQHIVVGERERYRLSPFAARYLLRGQAGSLAPTLDLLAAQASSFDAICDGMRDGAVPPALDVMTGQGDHVAFLDAVNAYLHWAAVELLRKAELPPVRSFIVGSMGVSFSARLLERHPGATVTYGCLSHLVREIPRLCRTYQVPPERIAGMHDHGGDPEADRWGDESYDLVFLTKKMILAPRARTGERFARKAFEVLRPGGAVVLWEVVHAEAGPTPLPLAMEAVLDLGASPGARPHTEASLRGLLQGIGYRAVDVVACLGGSTTFVVARKPAR